MRFTTLQAAIGSASILFSAQPVSANLGHRHAHDQYAKRHGHGHGHQAAEVLDAPKVAPRKARCTLPDHPDLVRVPGEKNNGFAMSPDQPCEDGTWCPLACVSGKVMAQWKPNTTYNPNESMLGGLYCNGGTPEKPFKSAPYCVDGTGAVKAVNKAGSIVSFCQTVLPGNEAMIIPTDVTDTATLAVPGPDYWDGTAAHYYINAPGIPASKGCVWGKITEPIGNWSPFVAGANTVASGDTYVKIAWNPEYLSTPLSQITPTFGLRIECPSGGCNGLPCAIDPSKGGVNGLDSPVSTNGVGGANFCVVTVPKGQTANIVVFNTDGSSGSPGPSSSSNPPSAPSTTSTVEKPTFSSETTTTTASSSAASSSSTSSSSSSSAASSSTTDAFYGGMFQEQDAQGETSYYSTSPTPTPQPAASSVPDTTAGAVSPTSSNEGAAAVAAERGSAIAGLVVALVAAAALF
ncbi:glycoside hydrolase family 132 protein [Parathielavia appendiculata]|uniref:Glycoside hydrolase family 132 protein n=1 Tax=Parathielavia appendiculata TaxID=2587402 RepID=A0AAN6U520_9PEZI|nr:glycoside hydrolase family 132 protein [Parathielavia appendiculata]